MLEVVFEKGNERWAGLMNAAPRVGEGVRIHRPNQGVWLEGTVAEVTWDVQSNNYGGTDTSVKVVLV